MKIQDLTVWEFVFVMAHATNPPPPPGMGFRDWEAFWWSSAEAADKAVEGLQREREKRNSDGTGPSSK